MLSPLHTTVTEQLLTLVVDMSNELDSVKEVLRWMLWTLIALASIVAALLADFIRRPRK